MGFAPIVLWGLRESISGTEEGDRHLQSYACSVARHIAELVLSEAGALLDGIVTHNACDTLRNMPEILEAGLRERGRRVPPFVSLHVPAAPAEQSAGAVEYLRMAIAGLIRDCEKAFGAAFDGERFRESVEKYRDMRSLALEAGRLCAAGELRFIDLQSEAVAGCLRTVEEQTVALRALIVGRAAVPGRKPARRVILSGILPPPPAVTGIIEDAGLTVAGNDIALMHRSWAYTPPGTGDPAAYYADLLANRFPCTTVLPTADQRAAAIDALVEETGAGGFIFIGEKFCEYEYFEWPWLEERLRNRGVRTLTLEISHDMEAPGQVRTRIETFAEMLG